MDRRIGDLTTAQHGVGRLDEVARVPGGFLAGACEAARRRFEQLRSAVPIPTAPAAGELTDTSRSDPPIGVFAGAFLGCLTTEYFSASGICPAIASALATAMLCGPLLVTRTAGLFAEALFPAIYGGTFAGMTPIVWLGGSAAGAAAASNVALAFALSLVCGLVFFVVARLDGRSAAPFGVGCGGRLGAIAVVASFIFVELVRPLGADTARFDAVTAGAFDIEPRSAIGGFLACLSGISATLFVLRQRRAADGTVALRIFIASAAALSGLIVLRLSAPDDGIAMDAFYAGCFLGMSTPDRVKGWLPPVSGALVLMLLLVPVRALLHGFGGGLGLAAFISVMLPIPLSRLTAWMTRDRLTFGRRLATATASAILAIVLTVGLISAEPVAFEAPISVGTVALDKIAELPDPASVRLVVGKPAPAAINTPIPIGISLINAAADDVVILTGLPPGSTMRNGRAAPGGWYLSAGELAAAAIRPARGFVGGADITVKLRRADQSIVDRRQLRLVWVGAEPAPRATTNVAPSLVAELSEGQIPEPATEDDQAIFRAFREFKAHTALEKLGGSDPARAAAVGATARRQHLRGQAAASKGPRQLALPFADEPIPGLSLRRRGDGRPKTPHSKSAIPAPHPKRPIRVSAGRESSMRAAA